MSFSSAELNYLILRYLEESGMSNSACSFLTESLVQHAEVDGSSVPNGSLVNIVQKGLAFAEYEIKAEIKVNGGEDVGENLGLSLLEAVGDDAARQRARERLQAGEPVPSSSQSQRERDREARAERSNNPGPSVQNGGGPTGATGKQRDRSAHPVPSSSTSPTSTTPSRTPNIGMTSTPNGYTKKQQAAAASQQAANGLHSAGGSSVEIVAKKVRKMKLHSADVFMCIWNPVRDIIGSGSNDSTAHIIDVAGSETAPITSEILTNRSLTLLHFLDAENKLAIPAIPKGNNKDVTAIAWDKHGTHLATGCYDGIARLWDLEGNVTAELHGHRGPIFSLKWSDNGNQLLSACVDHSNIVWDVGSKSTIQTFENDSSCLDVDWIDDKSFATCSGGIIHEYRIGKEQAVRTYTGHTKTINSLRYSQQTHRLASGSDDCTVKLWSLSEKGSLLFTGNAHESDICQIRWSPDGRKLASASFDTTVSLWDMDRGALERRLRGHSKPLYSVSYAPDGRLLASGSDDHRVLVWDTRVGSIVLSYTGEESDGGVYDVNWSPDGKKIAAGTATGWLAVLDVRKLGVQVPRNSSSQNWARRL